MKLALIFLSIFVAISHQQYYRNPRMMFAFPWLAVPFPHQPAVYNDYNALHDDIYQVENSRNIFTAEEEGEEFADTQSRINGISRYRPRPSFQDQQNARFLFNLFASTTGAFNNPLLKTATFTSTQTLTLASIVSCVPANNFVAGATPPSCRRRRSENGDSDEDQFSIDPSETLRLMSTALVLHPPSHHDSRLIDEELISTKDDIVGDIPRAERNFRDKRFFINKNQFVVSSTLTTFAFVNTTATVTVNLLNPAPTAALPCVAITPGTTTGAQQCVACLPAGFIVCPAANG